MAAGADSKYIYRGKDVSPNLEVNVVDDAGNVVDTYSNAAKNIEGQGNPKGVNIHGKINSELDEVDLINKIIYEDKNASKLYMENADFPQTEMKWAETQIFKKGKNRLEALQQAEFKLSSKTSLEIPSTKNLTKSDGQTCRIISGL